MNWVQRKVYLYNVTFGLYMLDWWERYLFNTIVLVLMWFIFYNSSRYVADFGKSVHYDVDERLKNEVLEILAPKTMQDGPSMYKQLHPETGDNLTFTRGGKKFARLSNLKAAISEEKNKAGDKNNGKKKNNGKMR